MPLSNQANQAAQAMAPPPRPNISLPSFSRFSVTSPSPSAIGWSPSPDIHFGTPPRSATLPPIDTQSTPTPAPSRAPSATPALSEISVNTTTQRRTRLSDREILILVELCCKHKGLYIKETKGDFYTLINTEFTKLIGRPYHSSQTRIGDIITRRIQEKTDIGSGEKPDITALNQALDFFIENAIKVKITRELGVKTKGLEKEYKRIVSDINKENSKRRWKEKSKIRIYDDFANNQDDDWDGDLNPPTPAPTTNTPTPGPNTPLPSVEQTPTPNQTPAPPTRPAPKRRKQKTPSSSLGSELVGIMKTRIEMDAAKSTNREELDAINRRLLKLENHLDLILEKVRENKRDITRILATINNRNTQGNANASDL